MTERNMVLDEYVAAITDAKDSDLPMQLGLGVDFFLETIEGLRTQCDRSRRVLLGEPNT